MQIFVRTLKGEDFCVKVELDDTVAVVKQKVFQKGGPEVCNQKLIFCGKECENKLTLDELQINDGSTFHVVETGKIERTFEENKNKQEEKKERDDWKEYALLLEVTVKHKSQDNARMLEEYRQIKAQFCSLEKHVEEKSQDHSRVTKKCTKLQIQNEQDTEKIINLEKSLQELKQLQTEKSFLAWSIEAQKEKEFVAQQEKLKIQVMQNTNLLLENKELKKSNDDLQIELNAARRIADDALQNLNKYKADSQHKIKALQTKNRKFSLELAVMKNNQRQSQQKLDAAHKLVNEANVDDAPSADIYQQELKLVNKAFGRFTRIHASRIKTLEQKATEAELTVAKVKKDQRSIIQNAEAQSQHLNSLKSENNSLKKKLKSIFSNIADILPREQCLVSQSNTKEPVPTHANLEDSKINFASKQAPIPNLNGSTNVLAVKKSHQDASYLCNDVLSFIQKGNMRIQFLTEGREIVKVIGQKKGRWKLENGRTARKQNEGNSWVWYRETPSVGIGAKIRYIPGSTRTAVVTGENQYTWQLTNKRNVDKNMIGVSWVWAGLDDNHDLNQPGLDAELVAALTNSISDYEKR